MSVQQEFNNQYNPAEIRTPAETDNRLNLFKARLQNDELSNIYPEGDLPDKVEVQDVTIRSREEETNEPVTM